MTRLTAYDKFVQQALKYGFSLYGTPTTERISSSRTGDDGYYQKGYPRQTPRFVDNGDGTITDMGTGLMWVKEPGAIGGAFGSAGSPVVQAWYPTVDGVQALSYAGHSDWRVPNIKELTSIVNYENESPAINGTFFPSCQSLVYWSGTTWEGASAYQWVIHFDTGDQYEAFRSDEYYVRPVRLGWPPA